MPRPSKPYIKHGWYVSTIRGKLQKLCKAQDGKTIAYEVMHQLENLDGLSVQELFDQFLANIKLEKSSATYISYKRWCEFFAEQYGEYQVSAINKRIVSTYKTFLLNHPRKYAPKTINHAFIAVRKAWNWAIELEIIHEVNPFAKFKALPSTGRKRVATDEEFEMLMKGSKSRDFKHFLLMMRHTPARPQDIYRLKWHQIDFEQKMIVIHEHKSSKTAKQPKPRIFGLSKTVLDVINERREIHPDSELVFLNSRGRPWTKDSLGQQMSDLRKKVGIGKDKNGENFVLYTNRHTFLTKAGQDPSISSSILQEIAGHNDPRTTSRYIHHDKKIVADATTKISESVLDKGGKKND